MGGAMFEIRRAGDRGHADHGWLDAHHSFSFADYRDPEHMHFGALRVLNDDRIAPTRGFGMHPHRDMEIVTYVLEGALAHRDSMGNGSIVRAGDVQRMSAGTGASTTRRATRRCICCRSGCCRSSRAAGRATRRRVSPTPTSAAGCGSSRRRTGATAR
ncbi:pirin, N-terminal [Burkholderia mallei SAVP1]|nr:pirin, N-terminal [Burkholderia mallei SAVP1]